MYRLSVAVSDLPFFLNLFFLLMFLHFCAFYHLPKSVIFIFMVFQEIFPSDLHRYHTLLSSVSLLKASFSRKTLHITHLLYLHTLYYIGCLWTSDFYYVIARHLFSYRSAGMCFGLFDYISSFSLCNIGELLREWGGLGSMKWV